MYTKGEWTIEKYELSYRIKGLGGSVLIATVHSSLKAEANACLMVQAPKLYEALKGYMMLCGNTAYQVNREGLQHYWELAQKAIAPVEGK